MRSHQSRPPSLVSFFSVPPSLNQDSAVKSQSRSLDSHRPGSVRAAGFWPRSPRCQCPGVGRGVGVGGGRVGTGTGPLRTLVTVQWAQLSERRHTAHGTDRPETAQRLTGCVVCVVCAGCAVCAVCAGCAQMSSQAVLFSLFNSSGRSLAFCR